jgi:hypothetical protein
MSPSTTSPCGRLAPRRSHRRGRSAHFRRTKWPKIINFLDDFFWGGMDMPSASFPFQRSLGRRMKGENELLKIIRAANKFLEKLLVNFGMAFILSQIAHVVGF